MQEIAEEAGVNQALLHYYFRSKQQLSEAVFAETAGRMFPAIIAILGSEDSISEKIDKVVETYLDNMSRSPFLPGYILSSQGDRMLMAHSVEGRFPFLDRHVGALADSLPASYKLRVLDEKHVLKKAARGLVPEGILARTKQPYRAPDALAFAGEGAEWIDDIASEAAVRDAGVFVPALVTQLKEASARTGEPVWELPLPADYRRQIDSDVADLRNIGTGRLGGALIAGLFLQEFVTPGLPWAHLDIAGPAWSDGVDGILPKGGTGFGARLLLDLLEHFRKPGT